MNLTHIFHQKLTLYLRVLCVSLFTAFCCYASGEPSRNHPFGDSNDNPWVELSYPIDYLSDLHSFDAEEQKRDWLMFAIIAREIEDTNAVGLRNALYDLTPLRHDYMQSLSNQAFGWGRSLPLVNNKLLLLVPNDSVNQRRTIQQQLDQYKMMMGSEPDSVILYEYRSDFQNTSFRLLSRVKGHPFFERDWGYVSGILKNEKDLSQFLASVDDLTFCQITKAGISVAGRRYNASKAVNITAEHVATLYDASLISDGISFSLDPFVNDVNLAKLLRGCAVGSNAALESLLGDKSLSVRDRVLLLQTIQKHNAVILDIADAIAENDYEPWDSFTAYLDGAFAPFIIDQANGDNRFFIPQDVKQILAEIRDSTESCPPSFLEEIKAIRLKLGMTPIGLISDTLWTLLIDQAPKTQHELKLLGRFLSGLMDSSTTIEPRFKPERLNHTEVGMIMFYTDFALKSNKQQGSMVYDAVKVNMPNTWSSVHNAYSSLYGYSRYWFTPMDKGFDMHADKMAFSYNTTQLNARSSVRLVDMGKSEVPPNYTASQYVQWWARHYETIADYETEYHRLDQLMKWSLVFRWAKTNKQFAAFEFLDSLVPQIRRDYRFQKWYANNNQLRLKKYLPVLPISKCSKNTTDSTDVCFDFKKTHSSGGVQLANEAQMSRHLPIKKTNQATRVGQDFSLTTPEKNAQLDGKVFELVKEPLVKTETKIVKTINNDPMEAILKGETQIVEATSQTSTLHITQGGFSKEVVYHNKPVLNFSVRNTGGGTSIRITSNRITPLENLGHLVTETSNPIESVANLPNTKQFIQLDRLGWAGKLDDDKDLIIFGKKNQIRQFPVKDPLLAIESGSDFSPKEIARTMVVGDQGQFVKQLQTYPFGLLSRVGEKGKNIVQFLKELPSKKDVGKTIEPKTFRLLTVERELVLKGDEANGFRFSANAADKIQKKTTSGDIKMLHGTKFEVIHTLDKLPKRSRGLFYGEEGQLLMLSKRKAWHPNFAKLTEELITPESEIKAIVFNRKAKGVRLLDDNIMEVPRRLSDADKAIAKETVKQINTDPTLADIYRSFDKIHATDNQALAAIEATNSSMRLDYVEIRNLPHRLIAEDVAVVSVRSSGATPQYLVRTAKMPTAEVRNIKLEGDALDFTTLDNRIESAQNLTALLKMTESEANFIQKIYQETKATTLVTIETPETGMSLAKISALHGKLPNKVNIIQSLGNLSKASKVAKQNPLIKLEETAIMTTKEHLSVDISRDLTYKLEARKSDIQKSVSYDNFITKLKEPKAKQIILLTEGGTEEGVLQFADKAVGADELVKDISRLSTEKDYIYVATDNSSYWQKTLTRCGKFTRIIGQDLSNGSQNVQKQMHGFFDQLYNLGAGKQPKNIDDLIRKITNDEVESLKNTPMPKRSFDEFIRRLKSIPDFNTNNLQQLKWRHF